jgi:tripartite-type tricarboxylate transporter receptor subunit TctC
VTTTSQGIGRRGALGLVGATLAAPAIAQPAWPSRPVSVVATFPPGGSNDFAARSFAQGFQQAFGQPAPVDNRSGAGGLIAAEAVARARPDGYTLLVANFSVLTMTPHVMDNVTLDPLRAFAPVSTIIQGAALFCVHASVPARTLEEFAAYARAQPGGIAYGSSGAGSHMAMEILRAGIGSPPMTHAAYRGSAPLQQDLLPGRVVATVDSLPALLPHVQAGTLRAILSTGERRSLILPELPTAIEAGVPNLVLNNWEGLLAPAGTPRPILERLNAYALRINQDADFRARALARGAEPGGDSVEEFTARIAADHARWGRAARDFNIRAG